MIIKKYSLTTLCILLFIMLTGMLIAQNPKPVYQQVYAPGGYYIDEGDNNIVHPEAGSVHAIAFIMTRPQHVMSTAVPEDQLFARMNAAGTRFFISLNVDTFRSRFGADDWRAGEILRIESWQEDAAGDITYIANTNIELTAGDAAINLYDADAITLREPPDVLFDSNELDEEEEYVYEITTTANLVGIAPGGIYRANRWEVGNYWQIQFSSNGMEELYLTSRIRREYVLDFFGDVERAGPRIITTEYSIDGEEFTPWENPVEAGGMEFWQLPLSEDWVIIEFALPEAVEDQENVWFRWRLAHAGGMVGNGYSDIADVVVTGYGDPDDPPPPPDNPNIASRPNPADEATDVAIDLEQLRWSYVDEDDEFAEPVGFRVYFGTDPEEFGEPSWVAFREGEANYALNVPVEGDLDYDTTYFWEVIPTTNDPEGRRSGRTTRRESVRHSLVFRGDAENTPVWEFTTEEDPGPPPPQNPNIASNPNPADEATDVAIDLEQLRWSYVDEDDEFAEPVGFRVYFGTDPEEFGEPSWVAFREGEANYALNVPVEGDLDYDTTYFWEVIPTTNDPEGRRSGRTTRRESVRHSLVFRGDAENTPVWEFTTEEDPGVEQFTLSVRIEGRGRTAPLEAGRDYRFAVGQEITATTAYPGFAYEFVEWGVYASDDLDDRLDTWTEPRVEGERMPDFDITAIAYFRLIEGTNEDELDEPNEGDDDYQFARATFRRADGTDDETLRYIYSTNWRILTNLGNPEALDEYYYFGTDDNDWFRQGRIYMRFNRRPHEVWWRPAGGSWHNLDLDEYVPWWDEENGIASFAVADLPGADGRNDGGGEVATPEEGQTLPVELTSFTVSQTAQMFVELQWVTETETNMLGYRIHRATENRRAHAVIISREIIPARNSSEVVEYDFTDEDVEPGMTYYYWLETVDLDLTNSFHGPVTITLEEEIDIPEPDTFKNALSQNYPNPFNPETNISFEIETGGKEVSLVVYNILGQKVKTLVNGFVEGGEHTEPWNGTDDNGRPVTSGIYFYRLSTDNFNQIHKMMLIK